MNKTMNTLRLLVIFFAGTLIAFSCNNANNENEKNDDSLAIQEEIPHVDIKTVDYPLNTPIEISKMLNEAGAGYIFDIANKNENIDKYMTEKDKALNLGVYGADLAYSATFNKSQETTMFFETCKKISEELGISNIYKEETVKKVEDYIDNRDTLHKVISGTFHDTYTKLQESGKGAVSVLVLAGGWVEGIHISTLLAQTAAEKEKIMSGIAEQKLNLDKLLVAMEVYKENKSVVEVLESLNKIANVFSKIDATMLTNEQLDNLTKVTEEVRAEIVK